MKKAVIYGATTTGKMVYEEVKNKYDIQYFVDGNPTLIGNTIQGVPIKEPEMILQDQPDIVIMGILTGYEEAMEYLVGQGYPEEKILCQYVDLNSRVRKECLEKIALIFEHKKINGAVAELGVYRGDFAKEINRVFSNREFYLFDTFEGFPEEDMDFEVANDLLLNQVGKLTNTSVELVLNKMPYPDKCIVKKGYFPDTTTGMEEKQFAFVNIDVDLYKPVLAGLEYFWPRMVENGYIFVHDYFSFSYAGARKAIEEFAEKYNVGFIPIGDTLSVAFVKKGKENEIRNNLSV